MQERWRTLLKFQRTQWHTWQYRAYLIRRGLTQDMVVVLHCKDGDQVLPSSNSDSLTWAHLEPGLNQYTNRTRNKPQSREGGEHLFQRLCTSALLRLPQKRVNRPTFCLCSSSSQILRAASLWSLQLPCRQFVFLPTQGVSPPPALKKKKRFC